MQEIVTIISTCGFPIAAFLIAWYSLKYCFDRITTLAEAINENTKTLALLADEIHDFLKKGE